MTTESQDHSIRERKAKLEEYIKKNPSTSTDEKERLEELKREERKLESNPKDVLY
jgi:hypothetical protein